LRVHENYGKGVAKGLGLDIEKLRKEVEADIQKEAPFVKNPQPKEKAEPVVGTLAPKTA